MLHAETEEDFELSYNSFKTFIEVDYLPFLKYFNKQWLEIKHRWSRAWRKVS